ncbi:uncharacterized protein E0L32_007304 [Thyridium curvatum]|uniref:Uncharacterized protein n=1 Tax=Thyridium curvatum TaxID=1093900 RepID=A0A507B4K2_9PEZI|nr:uncharacterized protein E0L32_007304 [Thyridium curvatum]TPX12001.1 hypothetical protein E0L32_007304 [Thyridium curvatum]
MATDPATAMKSAKSSTLPHQLSLKRDPDDEVQFLSEKPVKKRRVSGRRKSEFQNVQLPSPASLLAGKPAHGASSSVMEAQTRRLPSPASLLARPSTLVRVLEPLVINGSQETVSTATPFSSNFPHEFVYERPGIRIDGLPDSMDDFTFARAYHHTPETRCFSPPISPRTVPRAGYPASRHSEPSYHHHPQASRSYPDIRNNEPRHQMPDLPQNPGPGLGIFMPQHSPTPRHSIRGSADGAYDVPMLFPLSPNLNYSMCNGFVPAPPPAPDGLKTTLAPDGDNWPSMANTGNNDTPTNHPHQMANPPSVDPSLLVLPNSDQPESRQSQSHQPQSAAEPTVATGSENEPTKASEPGDTAHQPQAHQSGPLPPVRDIHAGGQHCELCAMGQQQQQQPLLPPMYMAPPFMQGQSPFNQQRSTGTMPMGMLPPMPPHIRPMALHAPYNPPWAFVPGAGPLPVPGGPHLPAGYPAFPGYMPVPTADMMRMSTAFPAAPSSISGNAPSTNSTSGETAATSSQTPASPKTGGNADTTTSTKPPAAAAPAQSSSSGSSKKHAQNLYVDIAETCEELLPLADIARRHGVSRQRVSDVFAAVVQLPLLRCPTDKRRVGKLGVARMKELNRGRKELLAEISAAQKAASAAACASGGAKAQMAAAAAGSASSQRLQKQATPPGLHEVAQFMGPLEGVDAAGGEQGGKGRW